MDNSEATVDKSEEIKLESSLLGFCQLNNDIVYFKSQGILIRNDENFLRNRDHVMLISGGGAGHEPGHNGFVGQGMLSAAVSGNIFTSPSVTSCLAAILQSGNSLREVLVIINNYTGDRLNFGLAVEMAQNMYSYQNVKMLFVDDDCSIDFPRRSTGRRGLAGVTLVHKIAGAMSVKGEKLDDIHKFCNRLLSERLIRTIGFSFHHDKTNELTDIEIGYGIHGEPGSIRMERQTTFAPIIIVLIEKLELDGEQPVVILFNNLGGASEFIFYQFVTEFLQQARELSLNIVKVYAGRFLTSLSKEALSVTIMQVDDQKVLEYLELPVITPAGHLFNNPHEVCNPVVKRFEILQIVDKDTKREPKVSKDEAEVFTRIITKACNAAIAMKEKLNEIDSELGDGDTGTTVTRGAEALLDELKAKKVAVDDPCIMLLEISRVLQESMGGTSGAIFSIFFQCASPALTGEDPSSIENWAEALLLGMKGIEKHGKAEVGDRTLLDALNEGLVRIKSKASLKQGAAEVLKAFADGCFDGAEETKSTSPKSGRSAYTVCERGEDLQFKSSNPDPGALAISVLANAIHEAFIEGSSTEAHEHAKLANDP